VVELAGNVDVTAVIAQAVALIRVADPIADDLDVNSVV
jgi:hypothetical protein